MRLIDQRGRLFGLINVIDLVAMLLLCSLAPFTYFAYQVVQKRHEQIVQQERKARLRGTSSSGPVMVCT